MDRKRSEDRGEFIVALPWPSLTLSAPLRVCQCRGKDILPKDGSENLLMFERLGWVLGVGYLSLSNIPSQSYYYIPYISINVFLTYLKCVFQLTWNLKNWTQVKYLYSISISFLQIEVFYLHLKLQQAPNSWNSAIKLHPLIFYTQPLAIFYKSTNQGEKSRCCGANAERFNRSCPENDYFWCSSLPGEMIPFDEHIFSGGLVQVPTSYLYEWFNQLITNWT